MQALSLQERYSPGGVCFGCGPANPRGLRIRSFPEGDAEGDADGDGLVCHFQPEPWQEAFEGYVNGGIISAIFDCHSNWTAGWALFDHNAGHFPDVVTAEMSVRMLAPTPAREGPLVLRAHAVEVKGRRASVESTLQCAGKVCATFQGVFVQVREGHPAWGRWHSA